MVALFKYRTEVENAGCCIYIRIIGETSRNHHITILQTPLGGTDFYKSKRRISLGDFRSTSSCNKHSHSSIPSKPKGKGMNLAWLFPQLKKHKYENLPYRSKSDNVSQILKDLGIMLIETLKKQLLEANENRDAALSKVTEMKSSLGDLKQKLDYLETYCEGLKNALKQAAQAKDS